MRDSVGKAYLMATITIYGIKNCDTMKKAQRPGKSPPDHAL
jgi:hypothetical protein